MGTEAIQGAERPLGLILAGGRGRRMGGRDKGLIEYRGRALVTWPLAALAAVTPDVVISANRNSEDYARLGHPVIADRLTDFQGPLAGIAAAQAACPGRSLLVAPCDAPAATPELFERLLAALAGGATAAVAHDGERLQPTFAALAADSATALQDWLARGERGLGAFFEHIGAAHCDCSDHPEWFDNLNRPQDLHAGTGVSS
ncbi:molybdenum cofactor guanylyltransferase MobA [Thiohalobacter sp.]|uniref:molybdenum cofactor guanylyltransferase MobA n=1 Tax=Thiohalobacter sp. TaxID=2025948 RepID=UPI0026070D5C|nr:molybdenum cofactor guanylyltransferase MobA [Thiohalobacter sp.]